MDGDPCLVLCSSSFLNTFKREGLPLRLPEKILVLSASGPAAFHGMVDRCLLRHCVLKADDRILNESEFNLRCNLRLLGGVKTSHGRLHWRKGQCGLGGGKISECKFILNFQEAIIQSQWLTRVLSG